jgi:phosphoglycolate phosphatase
MAPLPYRLAIFDFDGTLADSFPWFLGTMNAVADRYRFRRVALEEVEALRGHHARQIIAHVGLSMWKMPLVVRHVRRRMADDIDRIPVFAGIRPMLRGLAGAGVALAVVTTNSAVNVRRVLGPEAELVRYWGCGAGMFAKRSHLRRVLRESRIPAAECLSIGDEVRDLEASRAAGIPFGAVGWGYTRLDALAALGPSEVFAAPVEILERLTGAPAPPA